MPDGVADARHVSLLGLAEAYPQMSLSESVQGHTARKSARRAGGECHGAIETSAHCSGLTALVKSTHQGDTVVDGKRGCQFLG